MGPAQDHAATEAVSRCVCLQGTQLELGLHMPRLSTATHTGLQKTSQCGAVIAVIVISSPRQHGYWSTCNWRFVGEGAPGAPRFGCHNPFSLSSDVK